ncbi:hypothetical protein ACOSP7_024228 [Xanthoceras sorbifolium]|uniref:BHLH domain-containing protein n=1 Tax=Xanthoceras sorbifolium TaxID=99658 RepID=A0ABQ8H960_9ROSI|nr:hypothetical protein JRO89_XS13G0192200 [Xanthoceras sorbifolium]
MKKRSSDESSKVDRKTIERNRRNHMKALCLKLASLLPSHHLQTSKEIISQQDQLDQAAFYIKQMSERIDKLKRIKEQAMKPTTNDPNSSTSHTLMDNTGTNFGLKLPMFELRDLGSSIEVVLISGLQRNFFLYDVISILEEEGAEVVSASFSTVGDKVFHTLHAQVKISRVGVETSRVCERLQQLVY